jgi:NTE family protein
MDRTTSLIFFRFGIILAAILLVLSRVEAQPHSIVLRPIVGEAKGRYPDLPPYRPTRRPKVALVLSGGGARSLAAVGVLQVLERNHIPIDLVVGTSMGSVVGGLYASGYSSDQLQRLVDTTNWEKLLSYSDETQRRDMFLDQKLVREKSILVLRFEGLEPIIPEAFSSGQRLTSFLNLLTLQSLYKPERSFDDLKIPFRTVSTDLISGKRVIIDRGDLTEALRASMAVPLLYTSVSRDTMQLLDGGVLDNIPVDVAIKEKADVIIAVDMTSPLRPRNKLNALWEVADQITTIMMQEANRLAREKAHVVITPTLGSHLSSDFSNLDSLIMQGEWAAKNSIPAIQAVLHERISSFARLREEQRYTHPSLTPPSNDVIVHQERLLALMERGWIATSELQDWIDEEYATGNYFDLSLEIQEQGDSTVITVHPTLNSLVKDVVIAGNRVIAHDTLYLMTRSLIGQPLSTHRVEEAAEHIIARYRKDGYSLARIRSLRFDSLSQSIHIILNEGVIYGTDVEGNNKTRGWIVRRELPWRDSDIFTISKANQGLANVYGTSLFEQLRLAPVLHGDSGQWTTPTFFVQERSTELIRFGLCVDNERNIQPSLDIRDENLLGAGAEIGLFLGGGTRNQSLIGELKMLRIFNTYLTVTLKGYSLYRDINVYGDVPSADSYNIDRERIGEYREVRSGGILSFGTQLERLGSVTVDGKLEKHHLYSIADSIIPEQEYNVSSLRFGTSVDTQDKVPFPTDGVVINFSYESALVKFVDAVGFAKMYFSYDKYQTFLPHHTIHPHIALGVADETTPLSEQFSLGGQQTFFGYRENDTRGRQLLVFSLEYQYKLPFSLFFDTYFKARYDFGHLWLRSEEMRIADFSHGIGITLGLDTPIGPAEFSVGRSFILRNTILNSPVSFGGVSAYFTIGFPISGVLRN